MRFLLALLLLALTPAAYAYQAPATPVEPLSPALWVADVGKSKLYLFGTVHTLPRGVDWFRPHVVKAMEQADELVLEAEIPESTSAMLPLVMRMTRLPAARPVEERVPENWRPALRATIHRLQPGPMDWIKTWYIALMLSNLQSAADGMDPRIGVESVLTERAKMQGLRIGFLETAEEQLTNFDALTEADQQRLLMATLEDMEGSKPRMQQLVADWQQGNVTALAEKARTDLERTPMLKRMLMEDRHQRWAAALTQRLKTEEGTTLFVAVGAAHLAGKNSLVELLEQQGIKATRVLPEPPKIIKKRRRR